MSRIADIPKHLRPRERAWRLGINALESAELLALIIGSGVSNHSALDIAYQLTMANGGLIGLLKYSPAQFLNIPGIKEANAIKLMAVCEIARRMQKDRSEEPVVFKSAKQVYDMYHLWLGSSHNEKMVLVMLTHHNRVISERIVYQGAAQRVNVTMRDLYVDLFTHNAHRFVLVHNHPGGSVLPSKDDIVTTIRIKEEAVKLGLLLVDHVIISDEGYYSMAEHELIG